MCGVKANRGGAYVRPLRVMRSCSSRSGPYGRMGSTMISVCMNRTGAPSANVRGGVDAAMSASAARNSSTDVPGAIGPAPDDPITVMCGGIIRASFGSKRA